MQKLLDDSEESIEQKLVESKISQQKFAENKENELPTAADIKIKQMF